ncbi:hypothetical protein [Nocardia sp. CA-119907]|uniref:hypothetical protein n=1 Tax=Nocardia sp. CA-119907 TaxID=3239973 RepID=UPI003D99AE8B
MTSTSIRTIGCHLETDCGYQTFVFVGVNVIVAMACSNSAGPPGSTRRTDCAGHRGDFRVDRAPVSGCGQG